MKQVLVRQGLVTVEEVPAPQVEPGTLLVHVSDSCISAGTELSGIQSSGLPLWKRALRQPEKARKALQMLQQNGLARTWESIQEKTNTGKPTGYSAAGLVLEIGDGVEDFKPGDAVACAGAQCAFHAETIRVPKNLVVRIPDGLDRSLASTVTLGAIALQGVRRAAPTLGESFVVLGLGLLGQLTAQILKANGCRVVGVDLDRARIQLALDLGMDEAVLPENGEGIEHVHRLTDGIGADGVIITAATPSDEVVATAFRMCRKKGRVVLVGDVGLHLNRADFYEKELDFLVSTSYGPGRYDRRYEEAGVDYPVGYVRWTENRNMREYLRMLAEIKVKVKALIGGVYNIEEAQKAYNTLEAGGKRPLIVLLHYPEQGPVVSAVPRVANPAARTGAPGRIRLALVGGGSFATTVHLPNLMALSSLYQLRAVVSRTGHAAAELTRRFGAAYSSTDYQEMLLDREVDAVLICTRHNLHAPMVLEALQAGKHVLVEKPLALTTAELEAISAFYKSPVQMGAPVLLTGFNRRFSPYAAKMRELVAARSNPMIINYRMNAGYIPRDHWVHTGEGGGRNLGEACHIYDLFVYLIDAEAVEVTAKAIRPATGHYAAGDNFVVTIAFAEGSLATLTYTALGNVGYPKEQLELFVDGKVIAMSDYRSMSVTGARGNLRTSRPEKGHLEELRNFAQAIATGREWPSPLWQQTQATTIALRADAQLCSRTSLPSHSARV